MLLRYWLGYLITWLQVMQERALFVNALYDGEHFEASVNCIYKLSPYLREDGVNTLCGQNA
jgi:hypothetical protein